MSKSMFLTPTQIERLKGGPLFDRQVPGFGIVISHAGKLRWRFKRMIAGSSKTAELISGRFPSTRLTRSANGLCR